ncbi:ATP-binding protein [Actinoplanes palleronii]|uniref:Histidine kinase/HSP90-like ATPase domain-containing protein n=1 Tax=Actinoplanes palleronii TaxID=113570 RepID=A0ABQ4BKF8_9ACTN|nr:ATP-binding protein [Actinoplanes palleronii]GIE71153.1 hypothetical protein Apa02nite_072610 [Actinoplanes palleronii]
MTNAFLVSGVAQVVCVNDPDHAVTQVEVHGGWDGRLRTETAAALRGCLAETPQLLIVDLARLDDPAGESAPTWQTAARYVRETGSPTVLVLIGAPPAVARRMPESRIRLAASVGEALAAAAPLDGAAVWGATGQRRHWHLALPPELRSNALARTLAGDACLAFGVPQLTHQARLIMSELVMNAIEHAATDLDVRVSLRGAVLHLTVHDRDATFPRLVEDDPGRPGDWLGRRGLGLRLVAAAARTWGVLPCRLGKVVWATVAPQPAVATRPESAS